MSTLVAAGPSWLTPVHQPLEARVALERREVGIDPKPPGREKVRDLEQRLELVERLPRLAGDDVDPRELVLHVGTPQSVAGHRVEAHGTPTRPDPRLLTRE